jgi:hypothetical protein
LYNLLALDVLPILDIPTMQIQSRKETTNDHAFEALLQSQRELLSQMKYGNTTPLKWNTSNTSNTSSSNDCGFEKLVFNRRSSIDKMFPSHGGTSPIYELPSLDHLDMKMKSCSKYPSKQDPKKRKIVTPCKAGLYDDLPMKPDFSESSERSFELDFELLYFDDASSLIDEKEEEEKEKTFQKTDQLEKKTELTLVTEAETDDDDDDDDATVDPVDPAVDPVDATVDPAQVQNIVQAFRAAMERSQYTQQSIHDWDKKMGLKRSHSKTMRLSARSRKKLRTMFKREFTVLA